MNSSVDLALKKSDEAHKKSFILPLYTKTLWSSMYGC